MGMYTELVFKAEVKKGIPPDVEAVLQYLFNDGAEPAGLDDPFFRCERWMVIGHCSSYYHVPWNTSKYAEHYIFSRSDLKNYDGEIALFLDWVRPYLDEWPEKCIGWIWYEEEDEPTLIYARKEKANADD